MAARFRILITSTSFGQSDPLPFQRLKNSGCEIIENPYRRPLKEDELIPLLAGVDGVIAGVDEFTERVIRSSDQLKVISRHGVGSDNVDLDAARARRVTVATTPGVNTHAVADLTIGLMLAVARKIPKADISAKQGKWEKIFGHSIYRKTLGIAGFGRIGQAVFRRSAGFEMKVLVCDPWQRDLVERTAGVQYSELPDLLRESDFVTLHTMLSDETRNLIGQKELSLMKPTAYLINTARGALVNESDLCHTLKEGKIAGAALDTYIHEPPLGSPLLTLDNVVTTPHIGSYTHETILEMGLAAVRTC